MKAFTGKIFAVAFGIGALSAQGQVPRPNPAKSIADQNTAGPRVAPDGIREETVPQTTLVSGKKPRFALKPGDEIVEIDGHAIDSIEAAAKVHTDDSKIKSLTVRRHGKKIVLKPSK